MTSQDIDVVVIGGGPAGISACLELAKSSDLTIALFEDDAELGGMPQSCHIFFGMRDRWRTYTGPQYAKKLSKVVQETSVSIYTQAHVLHISAGGKGNPHKIETLTPDGFRYFNTRFVILAMGCFETSAVTRQLASQRPDGIYTTGALQQIVNIYDQKPGQRALIIGSEHIALSSLLTLRRADVSIAGIVEEDHVLKTYQLPAKAMSLYYGCSIYTDTSVKTILGKNRVEGVELVSNADESTFQVDCDTVIITGKFRPDSQLIDDTPIAQDPLTKGPLVDMNFMTSISNVFAAGNILRGADMHDLCALEGKMAAQNIIKRINTPEAEDENAITMGAEAPIRYVVPQKISEIKSKPHFFSWLYPGYSIQLEHTVKHPVLEAWSGKEIIWKGSFRKLIAKNRVLLPVWGFDWKSVNPKREIILRLRDARP